MAIKECKLIIDTDKLVSAMKKNGWSVTNIELAVNALIKAIESVDYSELLEKVDFTYNCDEQCGVEFCDDFTNKVSKTQKFTNAKLFSEIEKQGWVITNKEILIEKYAEYVETKNRNDVLGFEYYCRQLECGVDFKDDFKYK